MKFFGTLFDCYCGTTTPKPEYQMTDEGKEFEKINLLGKPHTKAIISKIKMS
jgi:hypothetical protein